MRIVEMPEPPEMVARRAGITDYNSSVGHLRRRELARLGNALGIKFATGASKDEMLEAFRRMENQGVDLLRYIPSMPATPEYSDQTRAETVPPDVPPAVPAASTSDDPKTALRMLLEKQHISTIKKITKEQGLPQRLTDTKAELIDRIVDFGTKEIVL